MVLLNQNLIKETNAMVSPPPTSLHIFVHREAQEGSFVYQTVWPMCRPAIARVDAFESPQQTAIE